MELSEFINKHSSASSIQLSYMLMASLNDRSVFYDIFDNLPANYDVGRIAHPYLNFFMNHKITNNKDKEIFLVYSPYFSETNITKIRVFNEGNNFATDIFNQKKLTASNLFKEIEYMEKPLNSRWATDEQIMSIGSLVLAKMKDNKEILDVAVKKSIQGVLNYRGKMIYRFNYDVGVFIQMAELLDLNKNAIKEKCDPVKNHYSRIWKTIFKANAIGVGGFFEKCGVWDNPEVVTYYQKILDNILTLNVLTDIQAGVNFKDIVLSIEDLYKNSNNKLRNVFNSFGYDEKAVADWVYKTVNETLLNKKDYDMSILLKATPMLEEKLATKVSEYKMLEDLDIIANNKVRQSVKSKRM